MEGIIFKTLQDDNIVISSYNDLFSKKRVLFCSTESPRLRLMNHYFRYLSRCQKKYKDLGVDEICVVDSSNDTWTLATLSSWFPLLTPIIDHKCTFLSYMKQQIKKEQSVDFLSANWIYQVLIKDGKIECFNEEATDNRFDHLKKNFKKIPYNRLKKYKDKKNKLLSLPNMLKQKDEKIFQSKSTIPALYAKYIFYGNVWPNAKLEEYLQIKK